ncbi:MAG TPA: MauE/DoxX family redox-associated membrane protein [Candidatus Binataceae bacterium]|nr:MauE/DoxX family redox-associated membrane protein [Candidatus Binataceae bacterium]
MVPEIPSIDPVVGWVAALAVAAIFAGSSAIKLANLPAFRAALSDYRIVPESVELPVAVAIPLGEMIGAAGILLNTQRALSGSLLIALLVVFSIAIAVNIARGRRDIDCGCFGPALRQTLSASMLVRNGGLVALCGIAMAPRSVRALGFLDVTTIAAGAASIVILYIGVNFLMANAPMLREFEARYA